MLLPLWLLLGTSIPFLIWLGDRGPACTTEGDSRVTSLGRLLRRMALDELPELLS